MTVPVPPVADAPAAPTADPVDSAPEVRTSPESDPTDGNFRPINSQEEFDNALKKRLERAEKSTAKKYDQQIADLTAKLESYENEKLSEQEKLTKRAEAAEKAAQERDTELTKLKRDRLVADLAHEAGLPKKLWDRVRGDDDDSIIADIYELMETIPKPDSKDGKKPPSPGSTVKVQPTGSDGETEETAESIIAKMSPRYR